MIIYEVNLTIDNDIFAQYYRWLIEHIEIMLTFKGFQQAEIAQEKTDQNEGLGKTKMTVRYTIDNEKNLDDYLQNGAPKMRAEGIEKFSHQFSAFRRIFNSPCIIDAKKNF